MAVHTAGRHTAKETPVTTPPPAKVCAVCARVLSLLEAPDGTQSWVHGIQDDDHLPVPVDRDEVQTMYRCDFCNMDESTYRLPVRPFPLPFARTIAEALDEAGAPGHMSGEDWAACDTCARYIELNQWGSVLRRATVQWEQTHGKILPEVRTHLASLHRAVRKNITGSLVPFEKPAPRGDSPEITEWGHARDTGKPQS
jgi:hypothetical protein